MEIISLHSVKPASYNPRTLTDDAKEELKRSLRELGCIKPIIVNRSNMTIIAGHQRTKTMLEMGITECPAYVLDSVNTADEVRFNQFHNRCEYEVNPKAPKVKLSAVLHTGFNRIRNSEIHIIERGSLAVLNTQLCRLISQYGEFGSPCSDLDGNVIISSAYAMAAKICGKDLDVYVLPNEKVEKAKSYFCKDYGKFNYDMLKKNTYIQGLAQMKRLRDGKKGKAASMRSTLYEYVVIPYLQKHGKGLRILDFGAGQMDYAKKLKSQGYNIDAVEPYHFIKGTQIIDFKGNTARYLKLCEKVAKGQRYDVVICDSVLNSVDSMEAERSVILTCKALTKIGGVIFMSGRRMEAQAQRERLQKTSEGDVGMYINFFDENGFTALYRGGEWFYQKFHDAKGRRRVLDMLGKGEVIEIRGRDQNFCVMATKEQEHDKAQTINALRFEFNMILPNGRRYGLQEEITKAYESRLPDN